MSDHKPGCFAEQNDQDDPSKPVYACVCREGPLTEERVREIVREELSKKL